MANIRFSQKVTGQERKFIAGVMGEAMDSAPTYAGAPTFAYEAGCWSIDKNSLVHSRKFDISEKDDVLRVIAAMDAADLTVEGTLRISIEGLDERHAKHLANILQSKETLFKRALDFASDIELEIKGSEVSLSCFNATLNTETLKAYLMLVDRLSGMAKTLKYASATEKAVENEKYAFRCFLLRLGFIGKDYKDERKVLLSKLNGNTAFRSGRPVAENPAEEATSNE